MTATTFGFAVAKFGLGLNEISGANSGRSVSAHADASLPSITTALYTVSQLADNGGNTKPPEG
jgi:hypothetical protein